MIIDIHTHCFPDTLAERAVKTLAAKAEMLTPHTDGTISDLRRSMKEAQVDISVIQNIATKPSQVKAVNDFAINSKDNRIIPFGSVHPLFEDYRNELKRLAENGIKGIKLHPDYQDFFVDEERMFPIYNEIFEAGLVLLFHAGVDVGLPEPVHCTPKRLLSMSKHFKGAEIIAAHMGGFALWDDVREYLTGSGIYIDTACVFELLDNDEVRNLILSYGSDKVLFGTDSPWYDQKTEISKIKALGLPDNTVNDILGGNSEKLLKLNVVKK